jgi:hypothetical protein
MTPEIEADLRTTVASLRVKTSCQELLLLALLPVLQQHQKEAIPLSGSFPELAH